MITDFSPKFHQNIGFFNVHISSPRDYVTVTGPQTIRAGEDYTFSVISHNNLVETKKIRVAIEGVADNGDEVFVYKDMMLAKQENLFDTLEVSHEFMLFY